VNTTGVAEAVDKLMVLTATDKEVAIKIVEAMSPINPVRAKTTQVRAARFDWTEDRTVRLRELMEDRTIQSPKARALAETRLAKALGTNRKCVQNKINKLRKETQ
jgi:hypothetical protein